MAASQVYETSRSIPSDLAVLSENINQQWQISFTKL